MAENKLILQLLKILKNYIHLHIGILAFAVLYIGNFQYFRYLSWTFLPVWVCIFSDSFSLDPLLRNNAVHTWTQLVGSHCILLKLARVSKYSPDINGIIPSIADVFEDTKLEHSGSCMLWTTDVLLFGAETSKLIGYRHKNNCQSDLGTVPKLRLAGIISNNRSFGGKIILRIFQKFFIKFRGYV